MRQHRARGAAARRSPPDGLRWSGSASSAVPGSEVKARQDVAAGIAARSSAVRSSAPAGSVDTTKVRPLMPVPDHTHIEPAGTESVASEAAQVIPAVEPHPATCSPGLSSGRSGAVHPCLGVGPPAGAGSVIVTVVAPRSTRSAPTAVPAVSVPLGCPCVMGGACGTGAAPAPKVPAGKPPAPIEGLCGPLRRRGWGRSPAWQRRASRSQPGGTRLSGLAGPRARLRGPATHDELLPRCRTAVTRWGRVIGP
jgi:hypothetical protein